MKYYSILALLFIIASHANAACDVELCTQCKTLSDSVKINGMDVAATLCKSLQYNELVCNLLTQPNNEKLLKDDALCQTLDYCLPCKTDNNIPEKNENENINTVDSNEISNESTNANTDIVINDKEIKQEIEIPVDVNTKVDDNNNELKDNNNVISVIVETSDFPTSNIFDFFPFPNLFNFFNDPIDQNNVNTQNNVIITNDKNENIKVVESEVSKSLFDNILNIFESISSTFFPTPSLNDFDIDDVKDEDDINDEDDRPCKHHHHHHGHRRRHRHKHHKRHHRHGHRYHHHRHHDEDEHFEFDDIKNTNIEDPLMTIDQIIDDALNIPFTDNAIPVRNRPIDKILKKSYNKLPERYAIESTILMMPTPTKYEKLLDKVDNNEIIVEINNDNKVESAKVDSNSNNIQVQSNDNNFDGTVQER